MVAIRKCRKYLAAITIWFMVFTSIPFGSISVLAADGDDGSGQSIAAENFSVDPEDGRMRYVINEDSSFTSITVPDDAELVIEGCTVNVTGKTSLGNNSQLTVFNVTNAGITTEGHFSTATFVFGSSVFVYAYKNYNLPVVNGEIIDVRDTVNGEFKCVSDDPNWDNFTLVYDGSEGAGYWVLFDPSIHYTFDQIPEGKTAFELESLSVTKETPVKIEGAEVITGAFSISDGGEIEICNVTVDENTYVGKLTLAEGVVPSFANGARMSIQTPENWPSFITPYMHDEATNSPGVMSVDDINNMCFTYDSEAGKWIVDPSEGGGDGEPKPDYVYFYGDESAVNGTFNLDNMTVDEDKRASIEGATVNVTGNLTVYAGGRITIMNFIDDKETEDQSDDIPHTGKLAIAEGTGLSFTPGVQMIFQCGDNVPAFIELYKRAEDNTLVKIEEGSYNEVIDWSGFEYISDGDNGYKWVYMPPNPSGPSVPSGPSDDNPGDQLAWERLQQEYSGYFAFGDWVDYKNVDDLTVIENFKTCIAVSLVEEFTYYVDSADSTEIHGGSRYQREGKEIGLQGYINKASLSDTEKETNSQRLEANLEMLEGMIEYKTSKNPDATLHFDNLEDDLKVYTFEVKIPYGSDDQKEYCTFDVKVVETPHTTDIIVEVGDKRFLYNADVEDKDKDGNEDGDYSSIDGVANTRAITVYTDASIYKDGVNDVTVYGNFASENEDEILSDKSAFNIYAVTIHGGKPSYFDSHEFSGTMAVIKKSFIGLAVKPDTAYEGANYVPDYMDANTYYPLTDTTWVIDTNPCNYDVYYGYDSITLAGYVFIDEYGKLTQTNLASVTCNLGDAVTIDDNADGTFTVTFNSDYYENVDLILKYEGDDNDYHINIHRTGIVIQNGRTAGNNTGSQQIFHGHNGGANIVKGATSAWTSKTDSFEYIIYATYYYPADVAEAGSGSSVDLFVTLTFADGSVESKLVESKYHTSVRDDGHIANQKGNAMDDYVIYIGTAQDAPVSVSAIAVPKPDSNGVVSRALFGQGIGVTKSINISDIER